MKSRRPQSFRRRIHPVVFAALSAFLLVGYLFETNSIATKSFELRRLDDRRTVLARENQRLEREIASEQSMENIKARLNGSNLVAVEKVEYVTPVGTVVASR